jgi:hypothetical protein
MRAKLMEFYSILRGWDEQATASVAKK